MKLLTRLFGLFRPKKSQPTEAKEMDQNATAGAVVTDQVNTAATATSNAPARLVLGMQLALSLTAAAPSASLSQVQAAATAALDVLLPAI